MKLFLASVVTAGFAMLACPVVAATHCTELNDTVVILSGKLSRPIFAGPPEYEDVRKGDTPEPAYILTLESPVCLKGDEDIDGDTPVRQVHLIPSSDADFLTLKQLIGEKVRVSGRDMFGSITGHHHAPLLMHLETIAPDEVIDPPPAMTTVEAFYLALGIGDGATAATSIVPEKRAAGPLSAKQLSAFYGAMKQPLELIGVTPLADDRFRARYHFETSAGKVCEGSSVVETRRVGDLNLISSISAEKGC